MRKTGSPGPALLLATIALLSLIETLSPAGAAGGRLLEVDVPAPSLEGNLLDTATVQTSAVYVPPSYDDGSGTRYPVLYLLHGIFDSYEVWPSFHDLPAMLDRLIAADVLPELIAVMPDAGNQYGGGFYRNSPVSGRWADYIVDDLIGYVDEEFRTVKSAESRAVSGHSMGGYGALHLAMTRPGVFAVVWAMSPCCLSARDDFGFGNVAWRHSIGAESPEDLDDIMASEDFYAIATLGVIAAFSPDVDNPPTYGEFPFMLALELGELTHAALLARAESVVHSIHYPATSTRNHASTIDCPNAIDVLHCIQPTVEQLHGLLKYTDRSNEPG